MSPFKHEECCNFMSEIQHSWIEISACFITCVRTSVDGYVYSTDKYHSIDQMIVSNLTSWIFFWECETLRSTWRNGSSSIPPLNEWLKVGGATGLGVVTRGGWLSSTDLLGGDVSIENTALARRLMLHKALLAFCDESRTGHPTTTFIFFTHVTLFKLGYI